MKQLLLSLFCIAAFATVHADNYKHTVTVTPTSTLDQDGKTIYLADIRIEDETGLIAAPQILIGEGKPTSLDIESDDKKNNVSCTLQLAQNRKQIETMITIVVKENDQVVSSCNTFVAINK